MFSDLYGKVLNELNVIRLQLGVSNEAERITFLGAQGVFLSFLSTIAALHAESAVHAVDPQPFMDMVECFEALYQYDIKTAGTRTHKRLTAEGKHYACTLVLRELRKAIEGTAA